MKLKKRGEWNCSGKKAERGTREVELFVQPKSVRASNIETDLEKADAVHLTGLFVGNRKYLNLR